MRTKEKVLEELKKAGNEAVSGEQMASICDVSRAAIWKAINSLRQEGWNITGTTNGGYVLESSGDVFSKEALKAYLKKNYPDFNTDENGMSDSIYIECFKEIDSTNTYAKRLLTQNSSIKTAIIVAESQTAGRGRLGRTFYSPMSTGIYLSVIYSPENGVTQPARLTASSAVAVCRSIKKLYGVQPSIKWINDIFVDKKKICGILTEGFTNFETGIIESAIIGIGVNIKDNPEVFPEDVKKIAGSILGSEGNACRCELAAEIAAQVLSVMKENPDDVLEEYKFASFLIGSEIEVFPLAGGSDSYKAKAIDIDDNAGLVVELADGSKRSLSSGEVTLHSNKI